MGSITGFEAARGSTGSMGSWAVSGQRVVWVVSRVLRQPVSTGAMASRASFGAAGAGRKGCGACSQGAILHPDRLPYLSGLVWAIGEVF